MQKITTFLTFNNQAEEAAHFYTSVFKDAKIVGEMRPGGGQVISVTIDLYGQQLVLLNGGPQFHFSMGMSLFVNCDTQDEVDELWNKLTEEGKEQPCGWLTDKFGVSWQIIPSALGRLLGNPDPQKSQRVLQAMMKMKKIDIAVLQAAAE